MGSKPKVLHTYTLKEQNLISARKIVPFFLETYFPKRVIDIGCGAAPWLRAFQEHGAEVLGIEGEHVQQVETYINKEYYLFYDLEKGYPKLPRFDLGAALMKQVKTAANRGGSALSALALRYFLAR